MRCGEYCDKGYAYELLKKDSAAYNCAVRKEVILTSRLTTTINYRPLYKSQCTREAYLHNALFVTQSKSVCNDKTAQAVQSQGHRVCARIIAV
jgi:hypothetical protein